MAGTNHNRELDGWKEIAGYLGVSVRTAQTFEKELGLPVRRKLGIKARVYGVVTEFDAWKAQQLRLPAVLPEAATSASLVASPPAAPEMSAAMLLAVGRDSGRGTRPSERRRFFLISTIGVL